MFKAVCSISSITMFAIIGDKGEPIGILNIEVRITCIQTSRCGKFLINQKACSCNVINRNDGANFPTVYSVFVSNK